MSKNRSEVKKYPLQETCSPELLIEITNRCLLNCAFCSTNASPNNRKYLDKKFIFRILKEIEGTSIKTIQLSGGEPFLHPDIWEIIRFILDRKFKLEIYSSGSIQSGSVPLDLLQEIPHKENVRIRFNLQGPNQDIHCKLTQNPEAFTNVIESIKNSVALGLHTEIHFLPTSMNFRFIADVISLCHSLNISKIKILRFIPQGRGNINRNLEMKDCEFREFKGMLLKCIAEDKIEHDVGKSFSIVNEKKCKSCQAGLNKYVIDYNQNLYPCAGFKQNRSFAIRHIQSFQEAINSLKFRKIIYDVKGLLHKSRGYSSIIGGCPCLYLNKVM